MTVHHLKALISSFSKKDSFENLALKIDEYYRTHANRAAVNRAPVFENKRQPLGASVKKSESVVNSYKEYAIPKHTLFRALVSRYCRFNRFH